MSGNKQKPGTRGTVLTHIFTPTRAVSPSHTYPLPPSGLLPSAAFFLYSDPPPPRHPPSDWLGQFLSQTSSRINTSTFSISVILHTYPPMKMERTECSETLAYKIQMPQNYPEESVQHIYSSNTGCDLHLSGTPHKILGPQTQQLRH